MPIRRFVIASCGIRFWDISQRPFRSVLRFRQTLPQYVGSLHNAYQKDGNCAFGRALPNWFPGELISPRNSFARLAASLTCTPSLVLSVEDRVDAILYKHEDEFKGEFDAVVATLVSSRLTCRSKLRVPLEVVTTFRASSSEKITLYGCRNCVLRVEQEDKECRLCFVAPPFIDLEENPVSLEMEKKVVSPTFTNSLVSSWYGCYCNGELGSSCQRNLPLAEISQFRVRNQLSNSCSIDEWR